jgi:hypothetical protein
LLIVANFAFGMTIVVYNAFLNDVTTEDRRNRVSSQGYALGYLGGGLAAGCKPRAPERIRSTWDLQRVGSPGLSALGRFSPT